MNIVFEHQQYNWQFLNNCFQVKRQTEEIVRLHVDHVVLREQIIVDPDLVPIYTRPQTDALLALKIDQLDDPGWDIIDNILY